MTYCLKNVFSLSLLILLGTGFWLMYDAYVVFAATDSYSAKSDVSKTTVIKLPVVLPIDNIHKQLQSLYVQLQAQKQKNAHQAEQIQQLLASHDAQNDIDCDVEKDNYPSDQELIQQRFANDQLAASYEHRFASELLDNAGSEAVKTEINELLNQRSVTGSEINTVSCAQSLCRIELQYDDFDSQRTFVSYIAPILMEARVDSFYQVIDYDDGSLGGLLFLSRDDVSLSEAESENYE